jgi:hypothetical protein
MEQRTNGNEEGGPAANNEDISEDEAGVVRAKHHHEGPADGPAPFEKGDDVPVGAAAAAQ